MATKNKSVVFTFGRMQPPSVGHQKVITRTMNHAADVGADHAIYVSHTQDNKRNPLSSSEKAAYIKHAMPDANIRTSSKESPSFIHIAKNLHAQGYKHLTMVAGSDRIEEYKDKLNKYNGPDKEFNFKSINVVSAGERDKKAKGVAGMSGTKMRQAALSGDKKSFKGGLMSGLKDEHKEAIYHKIRSVMGVKEDMERRKIPYLLMTEAQKREFLLPFNSFEKKLNENPLLGAEATNLEEEVVESNRLISFKNFFNRTP